MCECVCVCGTQVNINVFTVSVKKENFVWFGNCIMSQPGAKCVVELAKKKREHLLWFDWGI